MAMLLRCLTNQGQQAPTSSASSDAQKSEFIAFSVSSLPPIDVLVISLMLVYS